MKYHALPEEAGEWAALYAAGALAEEESRAFESHLDAGCPECQTEFDQLGPVVTALVGVLEPITPSPRVRAALLEWVAADAKVSPLRRQVAKTTSLGEKHQALILRRAAEAAWETSDVPGVSLRVLFTDSDKNQFTAMVRMAPGSSYPRHVHSGPEECLVLEGDLHVGETVLGPGDYQRAPEGSRHGVQSTEKGCLLLITSSLSDIFE